MAERPRSAVRALRGGGGEHVAEMQRRRLLHAFTELLAHEGFESANIGRICARAGVSRRTFYEHFHDRESCFLAAFEFALEHFEQRVAPAYRESGEWRVRLRRALVAALETFDREPELAHLCIVETLKGDASVLRRRHDVIEALACALDEGRAEATAGPSPLTAQALVGGALSVIHMRMLDRVCGRSGRRDPVPSFEDLVGPLVSMMVQPYLGPAAAARELRRVAPIDRSAGAKAAPSSIATTDVGGGPFRPERSITEAFHGLPIRFTYRTARVISVIAAHPGANNRRIAEVSGAPDLGQVSKLLHRLRRHELIHNQGAGKPGEANSWVLTPRGQAVHRAIDSTAGAAVS